MLNHVTPPSAFSAQGGSSTFETLSFSNANGISFSNSDGQVRASYTVPTVPAQTNQSAIKGLGVSNTGQTAGNTGLSTGVDWVLAGSQSITLSQSTAVGGPNTIWMQHPAWLTTAALSQDSSKYAGTNGAITGGSITVNTSGVSINLPAYLTTAALSQDSSKYVQNWKLSGNTAGTTSSAQGSDLWLAGGNGVTISGSSNTLSFSVATNYQSQGAYLTTARGSTDAIGLNTAKTNVTWTVNSSGLSLDAGGYAGTVTGATGASLTVNSSGVSINLPAYLTTADLSANSSKYIQNWKLTGNTAGTTSSAQGTDLWLAGGNGVTISGSSNTLSFSVATNYQSQGNYLTTARGSTDAIGLNTAKTNVAWTVNSSGLSFDAGGYAGTGFTSTTTAGANIVGTNNTAGLSIGVPAFLTTTPAQLSVGVSTGGNTSGDTGIFSRQVVFVGGNNITLSGSSNGGSVTYTISAPNLGAGAMSVGVSTAGNTAGSTGITGSQLVMVGTGLVSLSQSTGAGGGTVTFSVSPNISLYAGSNTFGTSSGTADHRTLSIVGAGGVSVAASDSGWVISGKTFATISHWENFDWLGVNSATSTFGIGTLHLVPMFPQNTLSFNNLGMIVSASLPVTSCGNTVSVSFATSGQSQQVDFNYTFAGSNLINLFLLTKGSGGSSSDLVTNYSTQNSIVTWVYNTYRVNASANGPNNTASMSNTVSVVVSFPAMTSATSTSVNAATTVTLWGPGYSSWGSTASGSTSSSKTTGATMSISIGSTYPATTVWSSNKLLQLNWAPSGVPPREYWFAINRSTDSGSTSGSAGTSVAAGRSFTSSINLSDLTMTAQLTYAGRTDSVLSSLGTFGGNSLATMGPSPGHGTFSATYAATKTFMNNAGQANGEIALSDIGTVTSMFKAWLQFNSNRI